MRRAGLMLAAVLTCAAPARALDVIHTETVTLKNGLRLVLAPDPQARSVDLTVWYDAGSRYDSPGRTGVAHLFEHLMFRGSSHFASDEHSRLVRNEGGSSGAYATHDFIAFYETLPPDVLELGVRLEADRMTGLTLTQQALDEERRAVAGERVRRDSPISIGLERAYALAFPSHPYGISVFGRDSDLPAITLKNCRDFYQAHFGPAHAVVTVVGNFRREAALELLRKHFEPIHGTASRPTAAPAEKPQTAERRTIERARVPVKVLLVAWRMPARSHADWAPLNLLSMLLTRAEDAPLQRKLSGNPPLALSIQGEVDSRRDASLFYLALAVSPDADSAKVERTLFAELDRLGREPVAEADLERAKRQTETTVGFGLQTTRGRAQMIGSGLMLAEQAGDVERLLDRVRLATAADLQRVAAQLTPARRNVVWLLPERSFDSGSTGGQP